MNEQAQASSGSFAARWPDLSRRAAGWLFLCYLLGAGAYLVIAGREVWFTVDDWDFLTRSATSLEDLFRDRNQHWATVWLVVYRALFHLFGVATHLPYTVAAASVHLTVAFLLRVVMRRAGVGPWTATVVASSYVLLGPAAGMMVAGFHPSLALGLGQLILADHDEGIRRRDWGALVCGALSIMGHNMGVVLVGIVGVAALLRRGWRAAAFHVLPLATMYLAWWLWDRPSSGGSFSVMWKTFVDWMRFGISGIFTAVGHYTTVAAALATVLVFGLLVAWVPSAGRRLRGDGAAPAALLCGAPLLLAAIFPSRAFLGVQGGTHGRFLWVTVALTLPAMAVAADALIRRRRVLAAPILLLFVVGIPANFRIVQANLVLDQFQAINRALFLALSSSPLLDTTPGWVVPAPGTMVLGYQGLTVAWLQQAKADGRLPPANPELLTPGWQVQATARLSVVSAPEGAGSPGVCRDEVLPLKLTPAVGDQIGITSPVVLTVAVGGQSTVLRFDPTTDKTIQIVHPVESVVVEADSAPAAFAPPPPSASPPPVVSVALCGAPRSNERNGGMSVGR